jgi:acetylornithine deacetylase
VTDDILADVRDWMSGQPSISDALAETLAIPSLPATLEQNRVLDVVEQIIGTPERSVRDRWVPDWEAVSVMRSPRDEQQLWAQLRERDPRYDDVLPELEVSVHRLTGGDGGTLELNGHVDVVPADGQPWSGPAFVPRVADGRMLARGSMDMKAGLVATAYAYRYLAERWTGTGTVLLALVPEEETGGDGTLATLHRGYIPDATVFAEPTDLQVVHRHVGIQGFDITATGREGGMLKSSWGRSVAPTLSRIGAALAGLEESRTRFAFTAGGYVDDDLPGFVNYTIHAGDWPATRAGTGAIRGLMGILPNETQAEATDALRRAVTAVAPDAEVHVQLDVWPGGHRGGELDPQHRLVSAFVVAGAAEGAPTRAGTMVCDAKIMQGGGWAPSVVLGPVGGGLHAADEWVDLASVSTLVGLLVRGSIRYLDAQGRNSGDVIS